MTDTNTTPALLPCPFCGEQPAPASQFGWSAKPGSWNCDVPLWRVHHVCGGWIHTEAEAIAAWNRRATPATDVVEREAVARAVSQHTYAVAVGDEDCSDWPEMSERAQNVYREAADAALSALAPYRTTERATEYARGLADGVKQSEAAIVAWLRSLPHYANLANQIERREHSQEAGE